MTPLVAVLAFAVMQDASPTWSAAVDAAVAKQIESQQLVGVSIGVIRDGNVVLTRGYGLADRDTKSLCGVETVMNWASNSKPMAGVLAMQLVEQKKLDLDADIRTYVPEWPDKGKVITTRHLLCHQSGIPHYLNGKVIPAKSASDKPMSLDPIRSIDRFLESPLIFDPGTKTDYSSYAYVLLSAVIQRAGGEPYADQVRKRIAEPLKLASLQLDGPSKGKANWATGYVKSPIGPLIKSPEEEHDWKFGAGGYKSDVRDFATWAKALMNRQLLTADSENAMWTRQTLKSGEKSNYGLSVQVQETPTFVISHSGGQAEVATWMELQPKAGTGIVVMCNCRNANVRAIANAVLAAIRNSK